MREAKQTLRWILEHLLDPLPYETRRSMMRQLAPGWMKTLESYRTSDLGKFGYRRLIETQSVFVHIPKAAGLSIATSLYGTEGGLHTKLSTYRYVLSKSEFESFFKFTFVRNPWDRLLSAYRFLKAGGWTDSDRRWYQQNLGTCRDFREFVHHHLARPEVRGWIHFRPQHEFLCLPWRSGPQVDFIGYFENIEQDFQIVRDRLGIPCELLTINKKNQSNQSYVDFYDDEMIRIVGQHYRIDVRMLGYTFDNSSLPDQLRSRSTAKLTMNRPGTV